jgi:hypothetical protein
MACSIRAMEDKPCEEVEDIGLYKGKGILKIKCLFYFGVFGAIVCGDNKKKYIDD